MTWMELVLTGAALSMDAFAVSVGSGMVLRRATIRQTLSIAGAFGLFQGLMPIIGYTVARIFAKAVQSVDHWIAFGLLAFIGTRMVWEATRPHTGARPNPCGWQNLLVMAIATSIDSMAVGVAFAIRPAEGLLAYPSGYLLCAVVIAGITWILCAAGVGIGCRAGSLLGKRAEVAGGAVLIGLGAKILLEHTVLA